MAGEKSGGSRKATNDQAASRVLRDGRTGKDSKSAAGGALAQTPSRLGKKK